MFLQSFMYITAAIALMVPSALAQFETTVLAVMKDCAHARPKSFCMGIKGSNKYITTATVSAYGILNCFVQTNCDGVVYAQVLENRAIKWSLLIAQGKEQRARENGFFVSLSAANESAEHKAFIQVEARNGSACIRIGDEKANGAECRDATEKGSEHFQLREDIYDKENGE